MALEPITNPFTGLLDFVQEPESENPNRVETFDDLRTYTDAYEGIFVYVSDEKRTYVLTGSDQTVADNWQKIAFQEYVDEDVLWEANRKGFRLPTQKEWQNEIDTWSSQDAAGAFDSVLKLPVAGNRYYSDGSISTVGSHGIYWSSTVDGSDAYHLYFYSSNAYVDTDLRARGRSVRLIKNEPYTGLEADFVSETIEIDGLTYKTVLNPDTGRVWLDRNLGATQVATASNDADSYGDLYQWGRAADGHEKRTSSLYDGDANGLATTYKPNQGNPWDGKFITVSNDPYDWLETQNDELWQGVKGTNNPAYRYLQMKSETDLDMQGRRIVNSVPNRVYTFNDLLSYEYAYEGIKVYVVDEHNTYLLTAGDYTVDANWQNISPDDTNYIVTDSAEITALQDDTNWDAGNQYTGSTAIDSGVRYIDDTYIYELREPGWIRSKWRYYENNVVIKKKSFSEEITLSSSANAQTTSYIPIDAKIIGAYVKVTTAFDDPVDVRYENATNTLKQNIKTSIQALDATARAFFDENANKAICDEKIHIGITPSSVDTTSGTVEVTVFYTEIEAI